MDEIIYKGMLEVYGYTEETKPKDFDPFKEFKKGVLLLSNLAEKYKMYKKFMD